MTASTDAPSPSAPPSRRWRGLWIAVAAVAVLALVAAVATFLTLRSGQAAGTQVEVRSLTAAEPADELPAGAVRLPIGRLDVTATRPLTTVPGYASPYEDGRELGRVHGFGRWVGVEWIVRDVENYRRTYGWTGGTEQFAVTLVADGTRHDLAAGATADQTAARRLGYLDQKAVLVALADEPDSLTSLRQVYADLDGPADGGPAGAPRQARGTVDIALTLTPA